MIRMCFEFHKIIRLRNKKATYSRRKKMLQILHLHLPSSFLLFLLFLFLFTPTLVLVFPLDATPSSTSFQEFEVVDISDEDAHYIELRKANIKILSLEATNSKMAKDIYDLTYVLNRVETDLTNSKKISSAMERLAKASRSEEAIAKLANENCITDSHTTINLFEARLNELTKEIDFLKSQLSSSNSKTASSIYSLEECKLTYESKTIDEFLGSENMADVTISSNNNNNNNDNINMKLSTVKTKSNSNSNSDNIGKRSSKRVGGKRLNKMLVDANRNSFFTAPWNYTRDNMLYPVYEKLCIKRFVDVVCDASKEFYYSYLEDIYYDYFDESIYFIYRKFHSFLYFLVNYYDSLEWYTLILHGIFSAITSNIFLIIDALSSISLIQNILGDWSQLVLYIVVAILVLQASYKIIFQGTMLADVKMSKKIVAIVVVFSILSLTYMNELNDKLKYQTFEDYDEDSGVGNTESLSEYLKLLLSIVAMTGMLVFFKEYSMKVYAILFDSIKTIFRGKKQGNESDSAAHASTISSSVETNNASITSLTSSTSSLAPVVSDDWKQFKGELVSVDSSKTFFPQRAFEFEFAGSFVIDQYAGDVGTIVWDAEVVLAHFMDDMPSFLKHREIGYNTSVLELGAGTSLAAMVSARKGASVAIQELEEVLPHSIKCIEANNCQANIHAYGTRWGPDTIAAATKNQKELFDIVIMADVLYHVDDFDELISTITSSAKDAGSQVIVCYEQRRRNIDQFFIKLSIHFGQPRTIRKYIILSEFSTDSGESIDEFRQRETVLYLYQFER